jgi:hypothetical protein
VSVNGPFIMSVIHVDRIPNGLTALFEGKLDVSNEDEGARRRTKALALSNSIHLIKETAEYDEFE